MAKELTVAEANQRDVGRSVARIPSQAMDDLGIVPGDIISIRGDNEAVATARRARKQDQGLDLIRIDGTERYNAETSLGETVTAEKTEAQPAKTVTVAPLQDIQFRGDPTQYFKQRLIDKPFKKGQKILIDVMGKHLQYKVTKTSPRGAVKLTQSTKLSVSDKEAPEQDFKIPEVSYEDIGGLEDEIEMVRELVEIPMRHPEVFDRLGIGAPKGVLLHGPPGTGKTLLAKAVASESEAQFFSINGPEIMSKYYGESEKHLREVFEEAEENSPAVIFIDEIDSIAPKRGDGNDQTEQRVVSQLLSLMDGINDRGNIVVIAATNRPDDVDPALRRPGRFDREIDVMPPTEEGRREILQIHTRGMPLKDDVELDDYADRTVGYTGADLEMLCKEAAMKALKPYTADLRDFEDEVPTNVLESLKVGRDDFDNAMHLVEPSAMRELLVNRPSTTWDDIGGLEDVKQKLKEIVQLPLTHRDYFHKAGIQPTKGVLLHGPPGTGKTMLAKAVANEANANFINIKGPELIDKYVGESEKAVRDVFRKARQVAPSIIFFDEFDSISKVRGSQMTDSTERIVNQLLTELDGVEELNDVVVIAATNRKDLVDPALLRPGRIDTKLAIDYPDQGAREAIFNVHTENMSLSDDVTFETYLDDTDGWTGADIANMCREAGMETIRRVTRSGGTVDDIITTQDDFDAACDTVSTTKEDTDADS
jgi:transitional endoplasmic reticulum ATPase